MALTIVNHPLARHWLSRLRDRQTDPSLFRVICRRLTTILILEASRDISLGRYPLETPLEATTGEALERDVVVVPILRAGLGMVEPVLDLFPRVSVGYVGLERDHETAEARSYYCKLPPLDDRMVLLVDPMLATGGSAAQAVSLLKQRGATDLRVIAIVAAPEGVDALEEAFPGLRIYTAGLDRQLDSRKYIRPGLGDFGDRLYGT